MLTSNTLPNLLRDVPVTDRGGERHNVPLWLVGRLRADSRGVVYIPVVGSVQPLEVFGTLDEWTEYLRGRSAIEPAGARP